MGSKWIYYNHTLVPDVAPHEIVETPNINREFWKSSKNKYPLIARWTSDFDCKEETNFWYIIRTAPYDVGQLSKSTRKNIRRGEKKCYVRELQDGDEENIYDCYKEAYKRYDKADNFRSSESIEEEFRNRKRENLIYYGAFDRESDFLIGFFICKLYSDYVETKVSKFNPKYMSLRPSDVLNHYILNIWLNYPHIKYINSGTRNLNHKTNVQEYKVRTFGYRKAYCKLHIRYRTWFNIIIKFLYCFKNLFYGLDDNDLLHKVNVILKMEDISRGEKI